MYLEPTNVETSCAGNVSHSMNLEEGKRKVIIFARDALYHQP